MNARAPSTVLVVDDSAENVTLLSRILKVNGYSVAVADNGADAVEMAKKQPPDLILLDINMPKMDGYETSAHLKSDAHTCDIPIIFISALDNIEDKTRAFRAGGMDYILKPFEYEEVQARIEAHLALRRLRVQLEQTNQELAARVEELTRSQGLLAERERRLSAFVEALPNLAFILDESGEYLEVMVTNPALLRGTTEELIGKNVEDLLSPEEAAKILDAVQQAIQGSQIQVIDYKVPGNDNREHWFEGRLACMEKDRFGHGKVVLMASEITERVHLYQEIQRLAHQDGLTGCFNRRYFMERAAEEITRSMRYHGPLSLVMMDIDHFKDFNDLYGHQVGDELLCRLVTLCQRQLREVDVFGRYGGEEFVVLMPQTNQAGALKAAERLQRHIEKMTIHTPRGKLSITVSMGVASFENTFDDSHTLDALIKRADTALYAAKAAGRNCVRASKAEPEK